VETTYPGRTTPAQFDYSSAPPRPSIRLGGSGSIPQSPAPQRHVHYSLLALACTGFASSAIAQGPAPTSACNNLTRVLLIAGGTSQTTIQCGQWSLQVTLPGVGQMMLSSPPQCLTSLVVRSGDTFGCSGTANGIHCNTAGDSITITTTVNPNPCPGFPATVPTTLAEARAATSCGALGNQTVEVNNSASIKNCGTAVPGHFRLEGDLVQEGSGSFTVRLGDPASLLTPPNQNEPFLTLNSLQTAEVTSLPLVLQETLATYPSVHGFGGILATVEYTFRLPGTETPAVNRQRIEGQVLADQRFSIAKTHRGSTAGGAGVVVTDEIVFDGATLFAHVRGNSTGNAWNSESPQMTTIRNSEAHAALMLSDWAYQPFWITRFAGTQRMVETTPGSSIVTITESYPAFMPSGPALGTTIYYVDTTYGARPVTILTKDAEGAVVLRRDFGDHRLVAAGTWRPFSVRESRFQPGSTEPWVVVDLSIQQASLLEQSSPTVFARPSFADEVWYVRR